MRNTGAVRRRIALTIVMAMLASVVVVPAPAIAAAGSFTGGPDQYPVYVPNDHTPIAVHFGADGSTLPTLAANTTYYLKVRFTVGVAPSGSTNRGFTWNPATGRWAQEREDWNQFPVVSTDASGSISNNAGWVFAKFGDEAKSGQYHLMISLSATGDASTFNGSFVPTVTVLSPRTDGGWVHNGVAVTSTKANKNVRLTDEASSTVLSLQKSEAQGVDDDANGRVDDEDYGPTGNLGDFRMATPATSTIRVNLNQSVWPSATSTFAPGPADTDIALGATDMVAPSAPAGPVAASGDGTAGVSWTAASDDTGVAGYYVYRWNPAPTGAAYSPVHARVATLAADATSYLDGTVADGTTYLYEVRAFDAATNVGPSSGVVTAAPAAVAPLTGVVPADPDGLEGWYRTTPVVTLTPSAPGRTPMYSFDTTAAAFTTYTAPFAVPQGVHTLYYHDVEGTAVFATMQRTFKVDSVAPSPTVAAPLFSVLVSTSRSYPISWGGTDAASGLSVFDVQFRAGASGAWVPWRAATALTSSIFTGGAGGSYYFRASATDVAGNTSAWITSNASAVPYDQTKASYSHGWATVRSAPRYLGSAKYTSHKGASASFTLSKGTLYLVTKTGPGQGKVKVYYRGHYVRTIDTYSKTTQFGRVFKLVTCAKGAKPSAVKIVNQATHGRSKVEIDGLALLW